MNLLEQKKNGPFSVLINSTLSSVLVGSVLYVPANMADRAARSAIEAPEWAEHLAGMTTAGFVMLAVTLAITNIFKINFARIVRA